MRRQAVQKIIILIALMAIAFPLLAQSTEADLKARLKDKTLYLRGCWGGSNLTFDGTGKFIGTPSPASFTLSGFELKSLQLKDGKLTLKGKRMGIEFVKGKQRFVPIHIDDPKIEITAPTNGDFGPALDAIFTNSLESLTSPLPVYWETWGRKNLPAAYAGRPISTIDEPQEGEEDQPETSSEKPKQVKGNVLAPRVLEHSEAEFDDAARKLKYSGKCTIRLIVGTDGRPRHVRIETPTGLGLDEEAVTAVQQYLFAPSTQNGKPVPVEIAIEVNFQVF